MEKVVRLNQPYWKSFKLPDGKTRWFYTDEKSRVSIKDKEWFNKNTISICIYKGYETEEYSELPVSEMIYRIVIDYQIANYFGDKSGMHFRNKIYMLIGDKLYKQNKGEGVKVTRMTKELKGALKELQTNMKKNNRDKCRDCECYKCTLKNECFECCSCHNNANFTNETKTKCCDRKIDKWK